MKGYLIYDTTTKELVLEDKPVKVPLYAAVDMSKQTVYPLDYYTIIVDDDNSLVIGNQRVSRDDIAIYPYDSELQNIINNEPERIIAKNSLQKIVAVDNANYQPVTAIFVNFILLKGTDIPLKRDKQQFKLALIRELNKVTDGSKEYPFKKWEQLLPLYGLNIEDVFKDEYKTHRKI